jgi:RNA polymerase sigma factor (TIGR02999 family)
MTPSPHEISQLLHAWGDGDASAFDRLVSIVYDELRRMARRHMARQSPDHTLQTTALIHEAYLKLVDLKDVRWQDRAHFFAVAAKAMRHILVDYARSRHAVKRGGRVRIVSLDEAATVCEERADEVMALDDALESLAAFDPRKCQVVELRYFGGLSVIDTAEVLNVSPETVARDWRLARTWLLRELSRPAASDDR